MRWGVLESFRLRKKM